MPLIKPEIQKVLRSSGLLKDQTKSEGTISEKLAESGLDDSQIAQELTSLALSSGNESLRLRALETALKVRGALKEAPPQIPSFTIVIQPASADSCPPSINPILFPRLSSQLVNKTKAEID